MNEQSAKDTIRRLGMYGEAKVAANTTIYAGTMVDMKIDHDANTAYAVNAGDKPGQFFIGVAMETVNSGSEAGRVTVRCWKEGEFNMRAEGLKKSDVGAIAYVRFDGTISLLSEYGNIAGHITEVVHEKECWVMINKIGLQNTKRLAEC